MANPKAVPAINQAGFINLYLDQVALAEFAREQIRPSADDENIFEMGLGELQQLTFLMLESEGGPKEILDDDLYRKRYSKVNLRKLALILDKYKNDKIEGTKAGTSTGNADVDRIIAHLHVVHKSDAQQVAKKLNLNLSSK